MLLNGVIDCPDIPLNVSRSFLQNDRQIQRISKYIVKKVADKLLETFKNDRAKYEEIWGDVANFVKFGCIKDNDFYDKIKDAIIYKDLNGEFKTIEQFYEEAKNHDKKDEAVAEDTKSDESADKSADESKTENKDEKKEEPVTIYYVSDSDQQAQYIKMFKSVGLNAMISDIYIDPHFITYLEYKDPSKYKFVRIDADIANALKGDDKTDDKELIELFKNAIKNDKLTIKTNSVKGQNIPAVIVVDEYSRRYSEMGKMYGMGDGELALTMIVNTSSPIVQQINSLDDNSKSFVANYIYSLALASFKKLTPDELDKFVEQNLELLNSYMKSGSTQPKATKTKKSATKNATEAKSEEQAKDENK
jgi:molecular chaperone HtpG